MEMRILVQQRAAITAWRQRSSSSKWDSGNSGRLFLWDPPVAIIQRWMKQPGSGGKCWMGVQSLQWSRNSLQSGNQKRLRRFVSPVMNAMQPTSEDVPVIGELKAELESLRQEATQARVRNESSRARFMRLAQVAERLQQRAVVDLKLGNEGTARQLLMEKKKVMSAADVSKRRSQLYELLSIKLSEAISQKETQLMVALTSIPAKVTVNEEPTVRVIFPKDRPVSFEEVLEQELEENLSFGVSGQPSSGPPENEDGDEMSPLSVEAEEGTERARDTDAGTVIRPEDVFAAKTFMGPEGTGATKHYSEVEDTDSSRTVWAENYRRESSKEDKSSKSKVESHLWEEMESAAKDLERDVLSLQEESQTSEPESILYSDEEKNVESRSRDEIEGAPGTKDTRMDILEAETNMGINHERGEFHTDKEDKIVTKVDVKLPFEEYLLDIDSQVLRLELKLQSFLVTEDILLGSNSEAKDEKVILVRNLLHQVQSLRTRILDGVNMSIGQQSQ